MEHLGVEEIEKLIYHSQMPKLKNRGSTRWKSLRGLDT